MHKNFIELAEKFMEEARVCGNDQIVLKVASAVDAILAHFREEQKPPVRFEMLPAKDCGVHDLVKQMQDEARLGPTGAPETTALDVLRKMNDILPLGDMVYDIREREAQGWEGPQVVAWGLACAKMKKLLDEGPIKSDNGLQPWPENWPQYYHRNEPCDMKVGPCSCGAWHVEDEFTLEHDAMGTPYVNRDVKLFPCDHVSSGGYNSRCNCHICKDIRTSVAMRDRG